MRIITCNVNGLRSAHTKGFTPWMRRQKADVVCLQEIKAREADLPKPLLAPRGLHAYFHCAEKRGYSGVAIYSKREPDKVVLGLGIQDIDAQGRFLPRLEQMRACGREFVICGDWNIAHKEIDLWNPKGNQRTTGFLPPERDWMTRVFESHGFVDALSNFGGARAGNKGWRIDYQVQRSASVRRAAGNS